MKIWEWRSNRGRAWCWTAVRERNRNTGVVSTTRNYVPNIDRLKWTSANRNLMYRNKETVPITSLYWFNETSFGQTYFTLFYRLIPWLWFRRLKSTFLKVRRNQSCLGTLLSWPEPLSLIYASFSHISRRLVILANIWIVPRSAFCIVSSHLTSFACHYRPLGSTCVHFSFHPRS